MRGEKIHKVLFLVFFLTKNTYIIHIGLTLAKSSSQEGFITYPTVTTMLPVACLQCKTYKKRKKKKKKSHEYVQQNKVPSGILIKKKKVVIRE